MPIETFKELHEVKSPFTWTVELDVSQVNQKLDEIENRLERIRQKMKNLNVLSGWIPCSERMPDGENEIYCLVTCQEWDMFYGDWGKPHLKILSYLPAYGIWNIKTHIKVSAWMPLPEIYREQE